MSLILVAVFVVAAASSRTDVAAGEVRASGYWLRKRWLAFLAATAPVVIGIGILLAPYSSAAGGGRTPIRVTSGQFFFLVAPASVPVGTRARLAITSRDVNHGVGLYGPDGVLEGTVQAMPGYVNHLDVTFDRPGTYRLLCFEYCGIGHHRMEGRLEVTRG